MIKKIFYSTFLLTILSLTNYCYSTHLLGGEISYKRTNSPRFNYDIKLVVYRETSGVDQPYATLSFGDDSCSTEELSSRILVAPGVEKLIFLFNHTFGGEGSYLLGFCEENRAPNIINIAEGNSVNYSFCIESLLKINEAIPNNSFQFNENPVLIAVRNDLFSHTIQGVDPEGDSLVFELMIPKAFFSNEEAICNKEKFHIAEYSLASMRLNPFSGNLTWDPYDSYFFGHLGLYTFSVKVYEYRDNELLGFTTRDFTITLADSDVKVEFQRVDSTTIKEFDVIDLSEDKKLELKVILFKGQSTVAKLEAFSELINNNKATFTTTEEEDAITGTFSFKLDQPSIRDNPFIVSIMGTSSKYHFIIRKDLTFILNPKKGKVFSTNPQVPPVPPVIEPESPTSTEPSLRTSVSIYPNPSNGQLFINFDLQELDLLIRNDLGLIVKKEKLHKGNIEINCRELKSGLYFIQYQRNGKYIGSNKLIIN